MTTDANQTPWRFIRLDQYKLRPVMRSVRLFIVVLCICVLGAGSAWGEVTPQEEARRLNQQAVELYQAGRYPEALAVAQRAVEIDAKALGRSTRTPRLASVTWPCSTGPWAT